MFVDPPGAGGFDQHLSQRLRGFIRFAGVNENQFQRNRVGITVGVADGDLDPAAAGGVDEVPEIVMRLDRKRAAVSGSDLDYVGAGLSLARSFGRTHVRGLEEPVNTTKRNDERICTAAKSVSSHINGRWCDQLGAELVLGPENDSAVSVAAACCGIVQNLRDIALARFMIAADDASGVLVRGAQTDTGRALEIGQERGDGEKNSRQSDGQAVGLLPTVL